jgi:hypothetical protein
VRIWRTSDPPSPFFSHTRTHAPLKQNLTTSSWRPRASKICEPLYDAIVEMPILAITLRIPSLRAWQGDGVFVAECVSMEWGGVRASEQDAGVCRRNSSPPFTAHKGAYTHRDVLIENLCAAELGWNVAVLLHGKEGLDGQVGADGIRAVACSQQGEGVRATSVCACIWVCKGAGR